MTDATPAATLIKKAIRNPIRAIRRLVQKARVLSLNETKERDLSIKFLEDAFEIDVEEIVDQYHHSGIAAWMDRRHAQLRDFQGHYRFGSTGRFDCETLYFLVRSLKPNVVVETGVCYGVSSAYILEALRQNGHGNLYSIDLGNTEDEPPNDFFVPLNVRDRWELIVGDCKEELPRLLEQLDRIDLFHHDSLHTYDHMMWEYETAFPHLGEHGVLSSHDVRTIVSLSNPFRQPFVTFCERHGLHSVKSWNMGIAIQQNRAESQNRTSLRLPPVLLEAAMAFSPDLVAALW